LKHRLFAAVQPDSGGKDSLASLNPDSLKVIQAVVEPSLASAKADDKFQFERHGYFGCGITSLREVSLRRNAQARCVADRVGHAAGKPVFNLAVGLKDSWGK
jgi:glutaminyl-tRNA synthetase